MNERLLRDTAEAPAHALGLSRPVSSSSAHHAIDFVREPSARAWYRAHNAIIVQAYLAPRDLAEQESRVERFFINLVLVRVLYAHALVTAPRLATSWLWPLAPVLGDPRLMMTGIFLSLSRVVPDRYPRRNDLRRYVTDEHGFGRFLDVGVIRPWFAALYAWSATELGIPELHSLHSNSVPYVWDSSDVEGWNQTPNLWARAAPPRPGTTGARHRVRMRPHSPATAARDRFSLVGRAGRPPRRGVSGLGGADRCAHDRPTPRPGTA